MIELTDKMIDQLFNPPKHWRNPWIGVYPFVCGEASVIPQNAYIYAATYWYDEGKIFLDHQLFRVIAIGRLIHKRFESINECMLRDDQEELNCAAYLIKSEQDGSLNWHVFKNGSMPGHQVATMLAIDSDTIGIKTSTHITYRHLVNIDKVVDSSLDAAAQQLLRSWGVFLDDYTSVVDETSNEAGERPSELWHGLITDW